MCCEEVLSGKQGYASALDEECWDDVNGRKLDAVKVRAARKVELQYFEDKGVG